MSAEPGEKEAAPQPQPESAQEPQPQPPPPSPTTQEMLDQTLAQQLAESEQLMYEQSQQQMQQIEEEVRKTQALVSQKETTESGLVAAYDAETSPEFHKKALELSQTYSHIRKIRGDGNCFYRAVLTSIIERVIVNRDELPPLYELVKSWRQRLFNFGFPELTTGDFCDAMETLLESIKDNLKTVDTLMDDLNQDGIANYYVAYLRLIASGYLRENEILYSGFIEGGRSLDAYCRDEIEPMWRECDHLSIIALVNALKTSLRIEYMDRSQAPDGGWHIDFYADNINSQTADPILHMLFRPGHYDLLYKKSATDATVAAPGEATQSASVTDASTSTSSSTHIE